MKRPAFQFYPADWLTDPELRSCSICARGMWIDMLCIAAKASPYGHLVINGKGMTDGQILNAIGGASAKLLRELSNAGVFSRTADGTIYSRRMVRDETTRNARADGGELGAEHGSKGAEHGAKGGRPRKETGGKKPPSDGEQDPPLTGETEPPIKPPPSSAVAFAVASALQGQPPGVVTPTVEASAVDKSTPDGDRSPEKQSKPTIPAKGWHKTNEGIENAAALLGITPHPGEQHGALKARLFERIAVLERAH